MQKNNEKMTRETIQESAEQADGRKTLKNRLRLNKETIKVLRDTDLRMAAGGQLGTWSCDIADDCF